MQSHSYNKLNFSLIELIVVIAIFAILASMMFPALKRSTEYGQIMICKNVMRQYHTADDLYAEDNNEAYVSIKASPWQYTWFRNQAYLGYFDTEANDLRNDPDLQCPNYTTPSYARFSYAPNWCNDKFWWSGFLNQSLLRNRVGLPSQKIKLIENTDWHANFWQGDPNRWYTNGEVGSNTVTYRHEDQCTIIFVDGHIELRSPGDVYYGGDRDKIYQLWRFKGDEFSSVY